MDIKTEAKYDWVHYPVDLPRENLVLVTAKTTKTTIHPEDKDGYIVRIFNPTELHEAARSLAQRPIGLNHIHDPYDPTRGLIRGAFTVDSNWNEKEQAIEALLFLPTPFIEKVRRGDINKVSVEYTWRDEVKTESGVEFKGFVFNRVDLLEGKIAGDMNTQLVLVEGKEKIGLMEGIILVEGLATVEEIKKRIKELKEEQDKIRKKLYPEPNISKEEKDKLNTEHESIEAEIRGLTLRLGQMIIDKEEAPVKAEGTGETGIKQGAIQDSIDNPSVTFLKEAEDYEKFLTEMETGKILGEPLGQYKNFADCRKSHSAAYCGYLYWTIEKKRKNVGKEALVPELVSPNIEPFITSPETLVEEKFEPPESGDLPEKGKEILSKSYASCRTNYPKYSKERCSKIAWGAVKNAGYTKKDDKWVKGEALTKEACEAEDCTPEKLLSLVEAVDKQIPEETNQMKNLPQQAVHQPPAPVTKPEVNVGSVGFVADGKGPLATEPEKGNPNKNLDIPKGQEASITDTAGSPSAVPDKKDTTVPLDTKSKKEGDSLDKSVPIAGTPVEVSKGDKSKQKVESTTDDPTKKDGKGKNDPPTDPKDQPPKNPPVPPAPPVSTPPASPPQPPVATPEKPLDGTGDPKDARIKELEEAVTRLQDNAKVADTEKVKAVEEAVIETKREIIKDFEEILPPPSITNYSKGARILAIDIRRKVFKLKESLKE